MIILKTPLSLESLAMAMQERLKIKLAGLGAVDISVPLEVRGNGQMMIGALAAYNEAGPGALTFAINETYLKEVTNRGASAVIVPLSLAESLAGASALICPEPRLAFTVILDALSQASAPEPPAGEAFFKDRASVELGENVIIGPLAYIGAGVKIGRGTVIGPQAFIGDNVVIGEDCLIHPRAVLHWGVTMGARCQIHSGAVLAGDGFGYTQLPDFKHGRLIHFKNVHLGGVLLGDDVEIGSQTTIDRGLIEDTVIGDGTKIDNLVQIAHNCRIGRDVIIVSQVGMAGHTTIGDRVFILGQSATGPGASVGSDAVIAGQSGVTGQVPAGQPGKGQQNVWMGKPAQPAAQTQRQMALARRELPRLAKLIKVLKKAASFEELRDKFFNDDDKGKDE